MAVTVVSNVSASVAGGGDNTTAAINTTGANLLVLSVTYYSAASPPAISDSKGNTWVGRTARLDGNVGYTRLYYAVAPTVGTGHTFSALGAGTYSVICVLAMAGAATTTPYDVENANDGFVTSLSTGSVTPSADGEIVITSVAFEISDTMSIDGGFTISNQVDFSSGDNFGGALAYLIQTTAAAANPSWSWTSLTYAAAVIATFKASSGAAATVRRADAIPRQAVRRASSF